LIIIINKKLCRNNPKIRYIFTLLIFCKYQNCQISNMATLSCTKADDVYSFTCCFFLFAETHYIFFTQFLFKITISTMTERWVRDSDTNPAHALLEELFVKKKISSSTTAGKLQPKHSEFMKFSKDVFRNVFRQMKAKYGVSCKFCVIIFFRRFSYSNLYIFFKF